MFKNITEFREWAKAHLAIDASMIVGRKITAMSYYSAGTEVLLGLDETDLVKFCIKDDWDSKILVIEDKADEVSALDFKAVGLMDEATMEQVFKMQEKLSAESDKAWRKKQYEQLKKEFDR